MAVASPPGAVVAYRASPLEDIVNVHWGGASFVAWGEWSFGAYYKSGKPGQFQALGPLVYDSSVPGPGAPPGPVPPTTGLGDAGQMPPTTGLSPTIFGSSYAKVGADSQSTFLACGRYGIGNVSHPYVGVIFISNDGLHWSEAFAAPGVADPAIVSSFRRMVWDADAKAFFAEMTAVDDDTTAVCWTSPDGQSWGEGGGDFLSHCKHGVEDGQYGFDPSQGTDGLLVTVADLLPTLPYTIALTFAEGFWIRTESAGLYVSVDNTHTWELVGHAGYVLATVIGGQPQSIPKPS